MIGLLLFFTIIALGLYGLYEYYKIKLGIIHKKMPKGAIEALANIIEDTNAESGRMVELGSGFGGFVIGIAHRLPGWDVVGVEQSPTPWLLANLRTIGKKHLNYRFFLSDPILWPLKNYDIVFIHNDEKLLKKWEQSLGRRLQPDTLLITMNHRLPRVNHVNMIQADPATSFYIYRKGPPAQPLQTAAPQAQPTPEQVALAAAQASTAAAQATETAAALAVGQAQPITQAAAPVEPVQT